MRQFEIHKSKELIIVVGVIKICSLVYCELLSLRCVNLENLCAHLSEDLLRIPKLCKLGMFWNPQELHLMMGTEILKIDAS